MKQTNRTQQLALTGESLACEHLKKLGYTILAQNYHSQYGEIDVIATMKDEIIFSEVKTRSFNSVSSALNCINKKKMKSITKTAIVYLSQNPELSHLTCRFDIFTIMYNKKDNTYTIHHFPNAFQPVFDSFNLPPFF